MPRRKRKADNRTRPDGLHELHSVEIIVNSGLYTLCDVEVGMLRSNPVVSRLLEEMNNSSQYFDHWFRETAVHLTSEVKFSPVLWALYPSNRGGPKDPATVFSPLLECEAVRCAIARVTAFLRLWKPVSMSNDEYANRLYLRFI